MSAAEHTLECAHGSEVKEAPMAETGDARVLLVDDESDVLLSLVRALRAQDLPNLHFEATSNIETALEFVKKSPPQVAVIDLSLSKAQGVASGFDLMKKILLSAPHCRVIVLTAHASTEHGISALKQGAAHFLEKPPNLQHLAALITDAVAQSRLRSAYERLSHSADSDLSDILVGKSEQIESVRRAVMYSAQNEQNILITGETGTGKGLCALAIHRFGPRKKGNFVRCQPNFASADLLNSEMFGHLRGAFTGASVDRKGLIAEAEQGTLFLDEIDELPHSVQVSLLGVLQDKKYRSVGCDKERQIDFRLICASNQDLAECLANGRVRRDFYHRIAHFEIHLPPLRERMQDIEVLVPKILESLRERQGLNIFSLDAAALEILYTHQWPGNVRELESVIGNAAHAANFEGQTQIEMQHLTFKSHTQRLPGSPAGSFHRQVQDFKCRLIEEALQRHAGNQVKAAKELRLDRSTLRRIIAR